MQPQIVKMMRIAVMIEVPAFEFVAMRKVWTKGITSGFERIVFTSPRQKQNVTNITKPREPLMITVHIIARGNVMEASLISSDIYKS
jgi:hypothetical protein